jgi:hypothetical protein
MTYDQDSPPASRHHVRRPSPAGLFGIGAAIGVTGAALSGSAVFAAIRRRMRQMEVPPRELARQKWTQTKAAAVAGADAWHNGAKTTDAH